MITANEKWRQLYDWANVPKSAVRAEALAIMGERDANDGVTWETIANVPWYHVGDDEGRREYVSLWLEGCLSVEYTSERAARLHDWQPGQVSMAMLTTATDVYEFEWPAGV